MLLLLCSATASAARRPAASEEQLPPPLVITLKNVRSKAGPTYKWEVTSRLAQGLDGPLYPGQSGTARVALDV